MIRFENINKNYNKRKIFTNLNFELPDKGLVFIIGESGSGKTTILNILSGFDSFKSGSLFYEKNKIKRYNNFFWDKKRNEEISYNTQTNILLENMTVYENLVYNFKKNEIDEEEISYYLKKLNLYNLKNQVVKKLSGGEKQRVSLIRTLIMKKKVYLFDEPTKNIDIELSKIFIDCLEEKATKSLVVVVTHDYSIIRNEESIIYSLKRGNLEKIDNSLFSQEKNLIYNKKFEQKENIIKKEKIKSNSLNFLDLFFGIILSFLIICMIFLFRTREVKINYYSNLNIIKSENKNKIQEYCDKNKDSFFLLRDVPKYLKVSSLAMYLDNYLIVDSKIVNQVTIGKNNIESNEVIVSSLVIKDLGLEKIGIFRNEGLLGLVLYIEEKPYKIAGVIKSNNKFIYLKEDEIFRNLSAFVNDYRNISNDYEMIKGDFSQITSDMYNIITTDISKNIGDIVYDKYKIVAVIKRSIKNNKIYYMQKEALKEYFLMNNYQLVQFIEDYEKPMGKDIVYEKYFKNEKSKFNPNIKYALEALIIITPLIFLLYQVIILLTGIDDYLKIRIKIFDGTNRFKIFNSFFVKDIIKIKSFIIGYFFVVIISYIIFWIISIDNTIGKNYKYDYFLILLTFAFSILLYIVSRIIKYLSVFFHKPKYYFKLWN